MKLTFTVHITIDVEDSYSMPIMEAKKVLQAILDGVVAESEVIKEATVIRLREA